MCGSQKLAILAIGSILLSGDLESQTVRPWTHESEIDGVVTIGRVVSAGEFSAFDSEAMLSVLRQRFGSAALIQLVMREDELDVFQLPAPSHGFVYRDWRSQYADAHRRFRGRILELTATQSAARIRLFAPGHGVTVTSIRSTAESAIESLLTTDLEYVYLTPKRPGLLQRGMLFLRVPDFRRNETVESIVSYLNKSQRSWRVIIRSDYCFGVYPNSTFRNPFRESIEDCPLDSSGLAYSLICERTVSGASVSCAYEPGRR